MRAARVLGDIAPNRAGLLTRWIRGIEEPQRFHRLGQTGVDHAGFDHRVAVLGVDLQDSVHTGALDDHRSIRRRGSTRKARSSTAGNEGGTVSTTGSHDPLHLCGVLRQYHRDRRPGMESQGITFVNEQLVRARETGFATDCGLESRDQIRRYRGTGRHPVSLQRRSIEGRGAGVRDSG